MQELALAADPGSSLTEIHVYVLANVIRRPIVVYARSTVKDFFGQDMAPCYFGGVCPPLPMSPPWWGGEAEWISLEVLFFGPQY